MEAQQATFGTFNLAAEKVAENLDEDSPGVTEIQDKMEEFNDRWNKITTEVSSSISLVRNEVKRVEETFCCVRYVLLLFYKNMSERSFNLGGSPFYLL